MAKGEAMNLKVTLIFLILLLVLIAQTSSAWDVDFSRRQTQQPQKFTEGRSVPVKTFPESNL